VVLRCDLTERKKKQHAYALQGGSNKFSEPSLAALSAQKDCSL
jgi:hypothetical protein